MALFNQINDLQSHLVDLFINYLLILDVLHELGVQIIYQLFAAPSMSFIITDVANKGRATTGWRYTDRGNVMAFATTETRFLNVAFAQ